MLTAKELHKINKVSDKHSPIVKLMLGKLNNITPRFIKYGTEFSNTWKLLNESEYWSKEEIATYQMNKLRYVLNYANEHVPYYKDLFNEISFSPSDFNDFSDLKKIPYLTKEIINKNRDKLVSDLVPNKYLEFETTGGSTGIPMTMYVDGRYHEQTEWAYITHQWKRIGYKDCNRCVGLKEVPIKNIIPGHKYWEMNHAANILLMSSYHMDDETIPLYIDKIRKYKPAFIQAYPSSLFMVVNYMRQHNIKPFDTLVAVMCSSENLYEWQRKLFSDVLGVKIFSHYGHTEQVCLAAGCEVSNQFHIMPQYGYTELINKAGEDCIEEGDAGQIISTGFKNMAMPLIRLQTYDIATHTNEVCSCGRNWKMMRSVDGRLQELIVTDDGRHISMGALNIYTDAFINTKQFQFHQFKVGKLDLNIVPRSTYTTDDTNKIHTQLMDKIGSGIELNIKLVDSIPRKTNKYKHLVQDLSITYGDLNG